MQLLIGVDMAVSYRGMQDAFSGAYIDDATVSYVLKDSAGTVVVTSTSMPHVASSDGDYRGTLPGSTALVEGDMYTIEITVSGGYVDFRRLRGPAYYREQC